MVGLEGFQGQKPLQIKIKEERNGEHGHRKNYNLGIIHTNSAGRNVPGPKPAGGTVSKTPVTPIA